MKFKDYFSDQSSIYAQFRPTYPKELFTYLASLVSEHKLAWDCATGNGQAALGLVNYFDQIIATDASQRQLNYATQNKKITYICAPAEHTDIMTHSVDLITIAQAIHWFDFDKFYCEVHRVLKPNSIIAAWCYPLFILDDQKLQQLINKFYQQDLKNYWPAERSYIDDHYISIPFPFTELATPKFQIDYHWSQQELIGYLNSWSAVQNYIQANHVNPIEKYLYPKLVDIWSDMNDKKHLHFQLILKVGRI